ncbi:MAG: non-ribosomal peptide synthetase, partial [Algicola sp.]|nr:non-ribosomal peptide synthetase [Algicola sp.]
MLTKHFNYWATQLAGSPMTHNLPLDKERPAVQHFAGATCLRHLDCDVIDKLQRLCSDNDATLLMGLHAAFSVLLSRYSNETDILVGTLDPLLQTDHPADALPNTLVLRSDLSDNPNFTQMLNQSKTLLLDACAHQQVSFAQLVEKLQPDHSLRHHPLCQVMLVLQTDQSAAPAHTHAAKYDLLLDIRQSEHGLSLSWQYNTELFVAKTIERMASHFNGLLGSLLKTPQQNVFTAKMLSDAEVHQQRVQYNDNHASIPDKHCIHQLFEVQAEQNPNAVAVVFA